ncbi:MAG: hypothetical protein KKC99_04245, partial [Proteobacteria bacterium]|nr:hypothetical protein [Pseudomonadota bacterium]
MATHRYLTGEQVHTPFRWVVADADARAALSGLVETDEDKLLLQIDDGTLWALADSSGPTWLQVGGGSLAKANTEEAEAGTDDDKYMTPLKTTQAIEALVTPGGGYEFVGKWTSTTSGVDFSEYSEIIVEICGGGASGGTAPVSNGYGNGGGSGGYAKAKISSPGTYTITIGGVGGTSSFGSLISCTGGSSHTAGTPTVDVSIESLLITSGYGSYGAATLNSNVGGLGGANPLGVGGTGGSYNEN